MGARSSSILAALCCIWAFFASRADVQAELDPYYVMRGVGFARAKPRILFVLDTSGSMSWKADSTETMCTFADCESGTGTQISRIAAARRAIRSVIDRSHEVAEFALMTFGQAQPPSSSYQVPSTYYCGGARFRWATHYMDTYNTWQSATLYGSPGVWLLCGDNRPYPYLRWDNLGRGTVITADDQTGEVPPSPLIARDASSFGHWENSQRKVQWFPEFMGVRANLNAETDPGGLKLAQTWGDYGNDRSSRLSGVWNQDFYYWPYVDGFPGYTFHIGWLPPSGTQMHLGVAEHPTPSGATLYAPFFLPEAASLGGGHLRGPTSRAASTSLVKGLTAAMHEGGVDVHGGTPWASTIGESQVTPPASNAINAHATVASYLRFTKELSNNDVCVPLTAVLLTDGDPSPASEGGSTLHRRLAALRNDLGADVYVVGFVHDSTSLNQMACAAAGSNNSYSPCYGAPADEWDTCRDPGNPTTACAYLADDPESLAETLLGIVGGRIELSLTSGPGHSVNEFGVGQEKQYGNDDGHVQTKITARTDWPSWRGHVERRTCSDLDADTGTLAKHCQPQGFDDPVPSFGPCSPSRDWDAGECLQRTHWKDRRVYSHDANNEIFAIHDGSGRASSRFITQLNSAELDLPGRPFSPAAADELVAFILGRDGPEGWKLPGLAQASPMVIRTIPQKNPKYAPSVSIRDPHCAGRRPNLQVSAPASLEAYADHVWSDEGLTGGGSPHREALEAVLIGDDMGMLHAFQLDSGNELWGLLPRAMLQKAVEGSANGAALMGQPKDAERHVFGLGGTVNHGWVFDPELGADGSWRHLAVVGAAKGDNLLLALDVSHMSPNAARGPVEILWTSEDPGLHSQFEARLGETWSRPALSYHVPNDDLRNEPKALLIANSGYATEYAPAGQGQTMMLLDALSGTLLDEARLPAPDRELFETNFANLVDPAVGTHCSSRFWAEAREVYVPDPAGRLYRWDLDVDGEHRADSGQVWAGEAVPVASFPACIAKDEYNCKVEQHGHGDAFHHGAAVVAHDRIDDHTGAGPGVLGPASRDQFIIALNSGSILEAKLDPSESNFHASLYLMVDDHRSEGHGGFDLPNSLSKRSEGQHAHYWRQAITDFERTRRYQPVPGGPWYEERRSFSKRAVPVRPPRLVVERGYESDEDGNFVAWLDGVEFVYVEYTIFEGPSDQCSAEWYDETHERWHYDEGSTYIIRGRMVTSTGDTTDFKSGSPSIGSRKMNPDRYGFTVNGLQFLPEAPYDDIDPGDDRPFAGVRQVFRERGCEDGNCSPAPGSPAHPPCDMNEEPPAASRAVSVRLSSQILPGFTPTETALGTR